MGGSIGKEVQLAKALKDACSAGIEQNPSESAEILYELGLIYRQKSPDKISLIRCAALINAAIVRQQSNVPVTYQQNLAELCYHVLEQAGAEKSGTNLLEISQIVKMKIESMRSHCAGRLQNLNSVTAGLSELELREKEKNKVEQISVLQEEITAHFTEIMDYISKQSVEIMGKPPCVFAVVGMGSLARKEITPYSDFEHVIILEEIKITEAILEYFRWFSVIFQIIIINLGESILRSVAIPFLNDGFIAGGDWFFDAFTKCGVKFDGMQIHACKFPLGRSQKTHKHPYAVELIKSVSEMVKLLTMEEDLKNGYHLADILTKTCFVSGDEGIYNKFLLKVQETLKKEEFLNFNQIQQQLQESLGEFDSFLGVAQPEGFSFCDVKRLLYRTSTIFISSLGRHYGILENSCFEIVKALRQKEVISVETAHKLSYAVAIACEVRLKVYMAKEGQDDHIVSSSYSRNDSSAFAYLMQHIGERSLADYFIITRGLQLAISKNCDSALQSLTCSLAERICIYNIIGADGRVIQDWQEFQEVKDFEERSSDYIKACFAMSLFYTSKESYSEAYNLFSLLEQKPLESDEMKFIIARRKGECLLELGKFDEAAEYLGSVITKFTEMQNSSIDKFLALSHLWALRADLSVKHFMDYEQAIKFYEAGIKSSKSANADGEAIVLQVQSYFGMGCSYLKINNLQSAFACAHSALHLCENGSSVPLVDECNAYSLLGECYLHDKKYHLALQCFEYEKKTRTEFLAPELHDDDDDLKQCNHFISLCSSLLAESNQTTSQTV